MWVIGVILIIAGVCLVDAGWEAPMPTFESNVLGWGGVAAIVIGVVLIGWSLAKGMASWLSHG